jgi:hypothetical protein
VRVNYTTVIIASSSVIFVKESSFVTKHTLNFFDSKNDLKVIILDCSDLFVLHLLSYRHCNNLDVKCAKSLMTLLMTYKVNRINFFFFLN